MSSKQTPRDGMIYDEQSHQWIDVTPNAAPAAPAKPEPAQAPAAPAKEK